MEHNFINEDILPVVFMQKNQIKCRKGVDSEKYPAYNPLNFEKW